MNPIEDFLGDWMDGQIRKFRAEIVEWEQMQSINIFACDFCGLELDDCECGGIE